MDSLETIKQAIAEYGDIPAASINLGVVIDSLKIHPIQDSMILMDIEEKIRHEVDDKRYGECKTIGDLVEYLDELSGITITLDEARDEGQRLLGDVVTDVMDKAGIAAMVKRFAPNCNCNGRRRMLNNLHQRITGQSMEESA